MEVLAIGEATWAGIGAFLTGVGALVAGWGSLRKAKQEERQAAESDCDERLLAMVERHQLWADEEIGKGREEL